MLGHQRRHQAHPRCATRVKGLGHGAKLFTQANRLRGGNADRHLGALGVQLEQAGAGGSAAQHAGGAGDVPAPVVVVGVNGVADTAGDLNADHQGVDQRTPRHLQVLAQRQQGRRHRASRVDDGFQVGVVKVKGVRADAIQQGGAGHVHPVAPAQHGGLGRGRQLHHGGQGRHHGLMARRADGAADPVGEGAVRFALDRVAPAP